MAKEDYYTSTVDGAAGWARCYAEPDYNDRPSPWELNDWPDEDEEATDYDDYDDDRPSPWDLNEWPDEDEEATDYDDYDRCNCSDPGCPCGGVKRGGV